MTATKILEIHREETEIDLSHDGRLFIRPKNLSIAEQQLTEISACGWQFRSVEE